MEEAYRRRGFCLAVARRLWEAGEGCYQWFGCGCGDVGISVGYRSDRRFGQDRTELADLCFLYESSPYTSIIVFLVRKGNPKGIKDWSDLIKEGVQVLTPNPRTSGRGALELREAAYGWAKHKYGQRGAVAYVKELFRHVPILEVGARSSTITFVKKQFADVLITWESEALLITNKMPEFEIVIPSQTILAEPPVAVVDEEVDKHGTRAIAEAYLRGLYSLNGQKLIAKHYFRPRNQPVGRRFPKVNTFTIRDLGGWSAVQKVHFDTGGLFDQISAP